MSFTNKPTRNKPLRRESPHHATITMKIDIRTINPDGTLEDLPMGNHLLQKYGITNMGQWSISGATEADCIKNLKKTLEKFNG